MAYKSVHKLSNSFDQNKDPFMMFLNSDNDYDYISNIEIPDKVVDFDLYNSPDFDIDKWYKSKPNANNSLFIESIKDQLEELKLIKQEAKHYYLNSFITVPQTPAQVNRLVLKHKTQILDLRETIKNRRSINKIVNKAKNVTYFVVKGYSSDEYGNVSRNYTKTVLKDGRDILSKLTEIYQEQGFECFYNVDHKKVGDNREHRRIDLLITKGSEKKVVEFSKMTKEGLGSIILNIEMWKDYKLKYKSKNGE